MRIVKLLGIKKKDFLFAFNNNLKHSVFSYHGFYVSLYAIKKENDKVKNLRFNFVVIRIGLIVSKKIGKAIKRNKIKRQLRVIIRSIFREIDNIRYYYIVISHKNIMYANYLKLQKDFFICLRKINNDILYY